MSADDATWPEGVDLTIAGPPEAAPTAADEPDADHDTSSASPAFWDISESTLFKTRPVRPSYQVQASKEFRRALRGARATQGAPVRRAFASDAEVEKPQLAQLLSGQSAHGGGRGGHLRIKVLVSLLWVCSAAPYSTTRPASAFAALLGLDDYQTKGARRVQQALRDLADRNLILLEQRGNLGPKITLLNELGSGSPYRSPVEVYNDLSRTTTKTVPPDMLRLNRYFRVPSEFWTQGWVFDLQGPATAMYLVMLAEMTAGRRGEPTPNEVWFSPTRAEDRFGISASTRKAGIKQLRDYGAITVTSRRVSLTNRIIDESRRRNIYRLNI